MRKRHMQLEAELNIQQIDRSTQTQLKQVCIDPAAALMNLRLRSNSSNKSGNTPLDIREEFFSH